jgi:choline kinase
VAVNTLECEEEEIKYRTHEAEQDRIVALSKAVRDAEGEALGVNKITADHLEAFVGALEECGEGDYFERGIELLMERGVFFQAVDVSDARCIEVDFEEDLAAARKLFSI